ncbi:hypothetical protein, partial [Pararhodospirillum oryzae]|uniref:hypothetical protein n=1 Tax=Pararhodospirillum oryzae TaxID=478448 RepID=UPI0011BDFE48
MPVLFSVPRGGFTFETTAQVWAPGAPEAGALAVTCRVVAPARFETLLEDNVAGRLSNADLVRALVVSWGLVYDDGTPIPPGSDEAGALLDHTWIARPILDAYGAALSAAIAGNLGP